MSEALEELFLFGEEKMEKAITQLHREFGSIRSGIPPQRIRTYRQCAVNFVGGNHSREDERYQLPYQPKEP